MFYYQKNRMNQQQLSNLVTEAITEVTKLLIIQNKSLIIPNEDIAIVKDKLVRDIYTKGIKK